MKHWKLEDQSRALNTKHNKQNKKKLDIHLWFSHSLTAKVRRFVFHDKASFTREFVVCARRRAKPSEQENFVLASNSANQCFFSYVLPFPFRAPPTNGKKKKRFFYYKALIFLKLFFIRVFVFVRKTHGNFSLSEYFASGYIKYFSLVFRRKKEKNGFKRMFCERFFSSLLVFRSWLLIARRIHKSFRGYASLFIIKNISIFFAPSKEKEVFHSQLSDEFLWSVAGEFFFTSFKIFKIKFLWLLIWKTDKKIFIIK